MGLRQGKSVVKDYMNGDTEIKSMHWSAVQGRGFQGCSPAPYCTCTLQEHCYLRLEIKYWLVLYTSLCTYCQFSCSHLKVQFERL